MVGVVTVDLLPQGRLNLKVISLVTLTLLQQPRLADLLLRMAHVAATDVFFDWRLRGKVLRTYLCR